MKAWVLHFLCFLSLSAIGRSDSTRFISLNICPGVNTVKFRNTGSPYPLQSINSKSTVKTSFHYSAQKQNWIYSLGLGVSDKGFKTSELLESQTNPYSPKNNPTTYYIPYVFKSIDLFLDIPLLLEKRVNFKNISLGICTGIEASTIFMNKSVIDYTYKKTVYRSLRLFEENQLSAIIMVPFTIYPENKFSIHFCPVFNRALFKLGGRYNSYNYFYGIETAFKLNLK